MDALRGQWLKKQDRLRKLGKDHMNKENTGIVMSEMVLSRFITGFGVAALQTVIKLSIADGKIFFFYIVIYLF